METQAALTELLRAVAERHASLPADKRHPVIDTVLAIWSQTTPAVQEKIVFPAVTKTEVPSFQCKEDSSVPTQEKLIADCFKLAGLSRPDAHEILLSALKLRGSPINVQKRLSAEDWNVLLDFLYPEITYVTRTKLSTILGAAL